MSKDYYLEKTNTPTENSGDWQYTHLTILLFGVFFNLTGKLLAVASYHTESLNW